MSSRRCWGISGNDFVDAANAKTIISWGGNPAEAYVHAWQFVCDAREKGAKLITVDPQFTASAMHSDVYVPVRPAPTARSCWPWPIILSRTA